MKATLSLFPALAALLSVPAVAGTASTQIARFTFTGYLAPDTPTTTVSYGYPGVSITLRAGDQFVFRGAALRNSRQPLQLNFFNAQYYYEGVTYGDANWFVNGTPIKPNLDYLGSISMAVPADGPESQSFAGWGSGGDVWNAGIYWRGGVRLTGEIDPDTGTSYGWLKGGTYAGTGAISFKSEVNGPRVLTTSFEDVSVLVTGVPEPATWAMMIAGFGLVGMAARRRQPVNQTA